jgi:hypothetical protein
MKPTKQQQQCQAKYGTDDVSEIVKLKSSLPQVKPVPVATKSFQVKMTAAACKAGCDAAGIEYLDGYEDRVIEYTLSDETVDRDGDIIVQAGIDLSNYVKNPVVLPFHDSRAYPVGNFIKLWVDITGKCLKGQILFPDERVDPTGMADRAFRFAKSRIMRAGSIGFRGKEVKFPTKEERVLLGMRDYGVIFSQSELVEFSLCPVPSNPNALSNAVKSGALTATDLLYVETQEDEEIPMTKEELDALLKAEIPKLLAEAKATEIEQKAGRTVSKATMARLKKMHERATEACAEIKALIDEHTEEEEEKPKADPAPVQKSAEEVELEELAAIAGEFKELAGTLAK